MTNKTTDLETQTYTEIHIDTTIDKNTQNVEIPLFFFDCFPIFIFRSVRADASHPHSFVLIKFSDSFERGRCEGLKREWLSVPQLSIVFQPSHPDTGSPYVRRACDCNASGT